MTIGEEERAYENKKNTVVYKYTYEWAKFDEAIYQAEIEKYYRSSNLQNYDECRKKATTHYYSNQSWKPNMDITILDASKRGWSVPRKEYAEYIPIDKERYGNSASGAYFTPSNNNVYQYNSSAKRGAYLTAQSSDGNINIYSSAAYPFRVCRPVQ